MIVLRNVIAVRWVLLTCVLVLVWDLFLQPMISSHTSVIVGTSMDLTVDIGAALVLVVHYRHHTLTKGQLVTGLAGTVLMAVGTAWMATTAPAGSVGDVLLFMCGVAVWVVLTLWVFIRALVIPKTSVLMRKAHMSEAGHS